MRRTLSILSMLAVALAVTLAAVTDVQAQVDGPTIGQAAPDFTLPDTHGESHALSSYRGEWVVLEWLNYECPFVRKHYDSGNMQRLQEEYGQKGVRWLAIVSSAPGKQGYHEPDEMNAISEDIGSRVAATLLDPDGDVGHMYGAQTTPQMVVINPDGVLLYNGAIDDKPSARASSLEGAHNYLATALDEAMGGNEVTVKTSKPYGCSVKYKN
jgi:hypothetical protein